MFWVCLFTENTCVGSWPTGQLNWWCIYMCMKTGDCMNFLGIHQQLGLLHLLELIFCITGSIELLMVNIFCLNWWFLFAFWKRTALNFETELELESVWNYFRNTNANTRPARYCSNQFFSDFKALSKSEKYALQWSGMLHGLEWCCT